jgi:hypothetical protein
VFAAGLDNVVLVAVPEPDSAPLLGMGGLMLVGRGRIRRARSSA